MPLLKFQPSYMYTHFSIWYDAQKQDFGEHAKLYSTVVIEGQVQNGCTENVLISSRSMARISEPLEIEICNLVCKCTTNISTLPQNLDSKFVIVSTKLNFEFIFAKLTVSVFCCNEMNFYHTKSQIWTKLICINASNKE